MGQQQLLLIVLGVVIVGIAIAVGMSMFTGQSASSNRDAIISDLNHLGASAHRYWVSPSCLGGGNRSYIGYSIPTTLQSNANGSYAVISTAAAQISITGISSLGYGTVTAVFGPNGKMVGSPTFTGQF
jgi:hypothetical protein